MAKQFLTKDYLENLAWQIAGSLAFSHSAFGLIIRSYADEYWLVENGMLAELEDCPEHGQMLIRRPNGDQIGLMPRETGASVQDKLKIWAKQLSKKVNQ